MLPVDYLLSLTRRNGFMLELYYQKVNEKSSLVIVKSTLAHFCIQRKKTSVRPLVGHAWTLVVSSANCIAQTLNVVSAWALANSKSHNTVWDLIIDTWQSRWGAVRFADLLHRICLVFSVCSGVRHSRFLMSSLLLFIRGQKDLTVTTEPLSNSPRLGSPKIKFSKMVLVEKEYTNTFFA